MQAQRQMKWIGHLLSVDSTATLQEPLYVQKDTAVQGGVENKMKTKTGDADLDDNDNDNRPFLQRHLVHYHLSSAMAEDN